MTAFLTVAILGLTGNLLRLTVRAHNIINSEILAKSFYYEVKKDNSEIPKKAIEKKIEDEQINLSYKTSKPKENSKLKNLKNILIEKIEVSWQEYGQKRTDSFISLVFKPEDKK